MFFLVTCTVEGPGYRTPWAFSLSIFLKLHIGPRGREEPGTVHTQYMGERQRLRGVSNFRNLFSETQCSGSVRKNWIQAPLLQGPCYLFSFRGVGFSSFSISRGGCGGFLAVPSLSTSPTLSYPLRLSPISLYERGKRRAAVGNWPSPE